MNVTDRLNSLVRAWWDARDQMNAHELNTQAVDEQVQAMRAVETMLRTELKKTRAGEVDEAVLTEARLLAGHTWL